MFLRVTGKVSWFEEPDVSRTADAGTKVNAVKRIIVSDAKSPITFQLPAKIICILSRGIFPLLG